MYAANISIEKLFSDIKKNWKSYDDLLNFCVTFEFFSHL